MNNQPMKGAALNRDNYTRCIYCLLLYETVDALRDLKTGAYKCPNGCVEPFVQPAYESPFQE